MNLLSFSAIRFALVGLVNTVVGLSVIYLMKWQFHLPDAAANLIGYAVGLVCSYVLNSRWTFSFRGKNGMAMLRFALVICVAYLANLAAVMLALRFISNSYIAQIAGIAPYSILCYLGSRYFAFPHQKASAGSVTVGGSASAA